MSESSVFFHNIEKKHTLEEDWLHHHHRKIRAHQGQEGRPAVFHFMTPGMPLCHQFLLHRALSDSATPPRRSCPRFFALTLSTLHSPCCPAKSIATKQLQGKKKKKTVWHALVDRLWNTPHGTNFPLIQSRRPTFDTQKLVRKMHCVWCVCRVCVCRVGAGAHTILPTLRVAARDSSPKPAEDPCKKREIHSAPSRDSCNAVGYRGGVVGGRLGEQTRFRERGRASRHRGMHHQQQPRPGGRLAVKCSLHNILPGEIAGFQGENKRVCPRNRM